MVAPILSPPESQRTQSRRRKAVERGRIVSPDGDALNERLHFLQRTIGNSAVNLLLRQHPSHGAATAATTSTSGQPLPHWTSAQLASIQRQLRRLGLYAGAIDHLFGPDTQGALVEAFGGDEWRTLASDVIVTRLRAAHAAHHRAGEHAFRYGQMFKDGVLDMTLGVGFDELGNNQDVIKGFQDELAARGFVADPALATRLYQQAGRTLGPSAFGMFFVRENALTYQPPAGPARHIHAVVRLVFSTDGSEGAQAAEAFEEGMAQSDISYYSGHGRFGSGPDFDRNMRFELLDAHGAFAKNIDDYHVLEQELRDEGQRHGRSAWQQFLWRVNHHRINVIGSNQGNVYLNPTSKHDSEFGGRLMYWNLHRTGAAGATPITGAGGALAQGAAANPERQYRLLVFNGCRTQDYTTSIRSTPGYDAREATLLTSRRTLLWIDIVASLASFLDSVLGQQSAEETVRDMDAQQQPAGHAFKTEGLEQLPANR